MPAELEWNYYWVYCGTSLESQTAGADFLSVVISVATLWTETPWPNVIWRVQPQFCNRFCQPLISSSLLHIFPWPPFPYAWQAVIFSTASVHKCVFIYSETVLFKCKLTLSWRDQWNCLCEPLCACTSASVSYLVSLQQNVILTIHTYRLFQKKKNHRKVYLFP